MLKDKVYVNNPHTAEELKENIRRVVSSISQEKLRRVFRNVLTRCEACLQAQGIHLDHPLWFKERTINVITCISDDKYSQFAVTSGKNGSQFLGY
jgi:hypothetical protein